MATGCAAFDGKNFSRSTLVALYGADADKNSPRFGVLARQHEQLLGAACADFFEGGGQKIVRCEFFHGARVGIGKTAKKAFRDSESAERGNGFRVQAHSFGKNTPVGVKTFSDRWFKSREFLV